MARQSLVRVGMGLLTFASMEAIGCTRTDRYHVAVFRPDEQRLVEPAPHDAAYVVKVQPAGSDGFDAIAGTQVDVPAGMPLGFERRADQTIVASAGDYRFDLAVPPDATLKWWAKTTHTPQIVKEMQKLPGEVAQGASVAGAAALEGALFVAVSSLEPNDACGELASSYPKDHRKHR